MVLGVRVGAQPPVTLKLRHQVENAASASAWERYAHAEAVTLAGGTTTTAGGGVIVNVAEYGVDCV